MWKSCYKRGWRKIGKNNYFCYSSWEANYLRYLEYLKKNQKIIEYKKEPTQFAFPKPIKYQNYNGKTISSYIPDFQIFMKRGGSEYHELKGWINDKFLKQMEAMKQFYPKIKIKIIGKEWFSENYNLKNIIKDWE